MELFAAELFGWSFAEFGDCNAYLRSMRTMLQNEIDMCNAGTLDLDNYGYETTSDLLEDNTTLIGKIDEALNA